MCDLVVIFATVSIFIRASIVISMYASIVTFDRTSTAVVNGLSAVILLVDTKTSFSSLLGNVVSFVDIVRSIAGVGSISSVRSGTLLIGVAG